MSPLSMHIRQGLKSPQKYGSIRWLELPVGGHWQPRDTTEFFGTPAGFNRVATIHRNARAHDDALIYQPRP